MTLIRIFTSYYNSWEFLLIKNPRRLIKLVFEDHRQLFIMIIFDRFMTKKEKLRLSQRFGQNMELWVGREWDSVYGSQLFEFSRRNFEPSLQMLFTFLRFFNICFFWKNFMLFLHGTILIVVWLVCVFDILVAKLKGDLKVCLFIEFETGELLWFIRTFLHENWRVCYKVLCFLAHYRNSSFALALSVL